MMRAKLIIGIALCGLTLAYFMHRYPIALPYAGDPEQPANFLLRDTGASAVLIVDTAVIKKAWAKRKFSEADFSYSWLSILEKQIGYFDVLSVADFTATRSQSTSFIVCSNSALKSKGWTHCLETLRDLPKSVIVILDFADTASPSARSSYPQNWLMTENFAEDISNIRQGAPTENFTVVNRNQDQGSSDKLESNDLIRTIENTSFGVPLADSLSLSLFNTIAERIVFPRWHIVPDTFSGIFLMTHDDEGIGDAGIWMNVYEAAHNYNSTTFLMPSQALSKVGVEKIAELGGEAALHWNRFVRYDKGAYDTISFIIDRWRPYKRRQNLQAQLDWLESLGVRTTHNRNHYFLWDDSYTRTFRILEAHFITMDFSYGPDLNQKGYIFGSAFPFHPLDENGAPFTLYETPVTWTENFAGADSAWIANILTDNAQRFHGVIVPLYHNNTYKWRPDYQIYSSWRRSYRLAQATGHKLMRVSELERFLENRRESTLNWTLNAGQLIVHCTAQSPDLAVLVPALTLGRPRLFSEFGDALPEEQYSIDRIQLMNSSYWRIVTPATPIQIICDRLENNIRQR